MAPVLRDVWPFSDVNGKRRWRGCGGDVSDGTLALHHEVHEGHEGVETLPILFQDEHLVAVHKPSGLLVHRSALDARETTFALQLVRDQLQRHVYAVHRLDKGTSGVLLFALTPTVGRALSMMFAERRMRKTYVAVVRGHPPTTGAVDHPLTRGDEPGEARPSLTRYRRLATTELPHAVDRYPSSRYALLELESEGGRQHQLRRHMKHIAHPIIGDANYGKGRHNRLFQALFDSRRLLLACVEVQLPHPVNGTELRVTAPLADDFMHVVRELGWLSDLPSPWWHAGAEVSS